MTQIASILAASEELHPLLMPPLAFGAVAFSVFLVLGIVTWTYRDVANRHSNKFTQGHDNHDAGH
jgi:hypothetical protein